MPRPIHLRKNISKAAIDSFYQAINEGWGRNIIKLLGKQDIVTISVLHEVLHASKVHTKRNQLNSSMIYEHEDWPIAYYHFQEKFQYDRQRTRRAVRKLEKLKLVDRVFKPVTFNGSVYPETLFLRLNVSNFRDKGGKLLSLETD